MSYTIHADLLVEQEKTAYRPSLSLTVQDNGLLHPVEYLMAASDGGHPAAVVAGSVIVRAKTFVAPGGVKIQRITDPSVAGQWSTWSATLNASANFCYLFYTGTYVVLVYVVGPSSGTVYWRRSSDGGATWSAEQSIFTFTGLRDPAMFAVAGAGATGSILAYVTAAGGGTVGVRQYNATADTWGSEQTHDYGSRLGSLAAIQTSGSSFILGLVFDNQYVTWGYYTLAFSAYAYPSTWGTPEIAYTTSDELNLIYALSLFRVGSFYTACYYFEGEGGVTFDLIYSLDGVNWSGNFKLNVPTQQFFAFVGCSWVATGDTYLVSEENIYISQPPTTLTFDESSIIAYQIRHDGPDSSMEISLSNHKRDYDGAEVGRLGADLILSRGAVCSGTAREVTLPPFVVDKIQWTEDSAVLTLRGHSYYKLLSLWRASDPYFFSSFALDDLVSRLAALAGIFTVTFDADTVWASAVSDFAVQPNQSALEALESLTSQYGFVMRITGANALYCFVLLSGELFDADYIISEAADPTDHPVLFTESEKTRESPAITTAQVVTSDSYVVGAVATDIQAETGRQYLRRVTRRYISSSIAAQTAAQAIVDKNIQATEGLKFVILPAFQLQSFDLVAVVSDTSDITYYLTGILEVYNTRDSNRLSSQTLYLSGAGASRGGGASAALAQTIKEDVADFKRGEIVSFNATTYKALVKIEGSSGGWEISCGQWLPAPLLTAGASVAVLLFDESNPSDGLVVGPYGAVSPVLSADTLPMPVVGSPTLNTLTEDFTTRGSAGVADGTQTYLTVGSTAVKVSVAAGEGYIRTSDDQQAPLVFCKWSASTDLYTFSAPGAGQETAVFFGISYNAGTPIAISTTTFSDFNGHDKFWLGRASYDGTTMEILNSYAHSEDTANLTRRWMRLNFPFTREQPPETAGGGLELATSGTNQMSMTSGRIWHGFNNYIINAIAAGATFDTHYKTAAGFASGTATAWNATDYSTGTALAAMTVNRYGTRWIYLDVGHNSLVGSAYNAKLDMVYGTSNATSVATAQAELAPSIPAHLTYHGRLIGRIIFQKSATAATVVESAWSNPFAATAVGDHTLLSNLDSTDYTHLSAANATDLTDGGLTTLHTHTAKQVGAQPYNYLINGGFYYFQRIAPLAETAMSNDVYNAPDRFYSLVQGANAKIRRNPGIGTSQHSCQLIAGGTTNRYGIAQIIEAENSIPLRGQTVIAQVLVNPVNNAGSGTRNYRIAILEWTGTADTVTSELVANWTSGTFTTAGFFASTTKTLVGTAVVTATHNAESVLSVSGAVSTSCNNLIVFIWTQDVPTHASDYVLIGEAGLYVLATAQAWSERPIQQELALCQRYYEVGLPNIGPTRSSGYDLEMTCVTSVIATGVQYGQWPYLVAKRTAPTVAIHPYTTGTDTGKVSNNVGTDLAANSGGSVGNRNRLAVQNNSGGDVTTGGLILFKYEADAEL